MSATDGSRWALSIDFGTTSTAAAMRTNGTPATVELDNRPRMASTVCWRAPYGSEPGRVLVGPAADNQWMLDPGAAVRCPKYKIGQEYMQLGEERVAVTDAIAKIFRYVIDEANRRQGFVAPTQLLLTHPARWGEGHRRKLREASATAGYDDPVLIPEPVAAATYFAEAQLAPGDLVAVYDLGGGTFDTAILRRTEDGFKVVGVPGGREDLGGEDFDDRLFRYLGSQLDGDEWSRLTDPEADLLSTRALAAFKREVRHAKERLSKYTDATVMTPVSSHADLRVSRPEFENLIRDDIERTVTELERTISSARIQVPDLAAIYLAGGSSQIPLIADTVERRLGHRPKVLGDPKAVTSLGAVAFPKYRAPHRHESAHLGSDPVDDGGSHSGAKPPVDDKPPGVPITSGTRINPHFVLAIFSLLFFFPTGVVAVVQASRSKTRFSEGDRDGAGRASRKALRFALVSIAITVVLIGIGIAFGGHHGGTGTGTGTGT